MEMGSGFCVGGLLNILLHFQVPRCAFKSLSHLESAVIYFLCARSSLWAPLKCVLRSSSLQPCIEGAI